MNKFALILIALLFTGCMLHAINNDMIDNQFLSKQPVAIPFNGTWTGAVGPYILTFQLMSDGNGLMCYSRDSSNTVINKLKVYSKDRTDFGMIQDTGSKSRLALNTDKSLTFNSYGKDYSLQPDNSMELANIACKEKLTKVK